MSNRIGIVSIVAFVAIAVLLCGCEQNRKGVSSLSAAAPLTLDCVISIRQPDGSQYFTEQEHKIYPEKRAIFFTTEEPQGKYEWSVIDNKYLGPKAGKKLPLSSELIFNKAVSISLLKLYLANPSTAEEYNSADFSGNTLKIDGQLYGKINQDDTDISLFRNLSTGKINVAKIKGKSSYILRGYNYQKINKYGILIPAKIDVFVDKDNNDKELTAQFNCYVKN